MKIKKETIKAGILIFIMVAIAIGIFLANYTNN